MNDVLLNIIINQQTYVIFLLKWMTCLKYHQPANIEDRCLSFHMLLLFMQSCCPLCVFYVCCVYVMLFLMCVCVCVSAHAQMHETKYVASVHLSVYWHLILTLRSLSSSLVHGVGTRHLAHTFQHSQWIPHQT